MLKAHILNRAASLNSFEAIGTLEFIPGEQTTLAIQLFQPDRADQLRYVAGDSDTLTLSLPKTDGTDESVTMTALSGDKSIWTATLEESLTTELLGGNFTFELDVGGAGTNLIKGWVEGGLSRIITGQV